MVETFIIQWISLISCMLRVWAKRNLVLTFSSRPENLTPNFCHLGCHIEWLMFGANPSIKPWAGKKNWRTKGKLEPKNKNSKCTQLLGSKLPCVHPYPTPHKPRPNLYMECERSWVEPRGVARIPKLAQFIWQLSSWRANLPPLQCP